MSAGVVAVVGLGYVGLPLAVEFGKKRPTVGFDLSAIDPDIPLPDGSVDAVLAGQAWHWFDHLGAAGEFGRVLRTGGVVGLLWNVRDERLGWVREFGQIVGLEHDWANTTVVLPRPFTDVQTHRVEWTNYITPQALIDYVASRSYCITSPAEARTRTLDEVRTMLATHPSLAGAEGIALPYVTACARAMLG